MLIIHATDNRGCVSDLLMIHAYIISMTLFLGVGDSCLGYFKLLIFVFFTMVSLPVLLLHMTELLSDL